MNNFRNLFEYSVPSEKKIILERLINCKITNIIKCSFESYTDHIAYLDEVELVGYRDTISFFKYSYGALLIIFDNNEEYSFAAADDINSVIIRCQKDQYGKKYENYILEDPDVQDKMSVQDFYDQSEFKHMLNTKIKRINILSSKNINAKQQALYSERGVEFLFENEKKLILSHNLAEKSFVFGVLSEQDKISLSTIVKYSYS